METENKFEKLENLLREALTELSRLKNPNKGLPVRFKRDKAQLFLQEYSFEALDAAFQWGSTPQGEGYWEDIAEGCDAHPPKKVPEEAIICIQEWVIESLSLEVGHGGASMYDFQ